MTIIKKPNGLRVETFYRSISTERKSLARRIKRDRKDHIVGFICRDNGYSHYGVVSRDGFAVSRIEHRPGLCCKKTSEPAMYEVL